MSPQTTFLIFGATGQTGRHFTSRVLEDGRHARVLVRDPAKLSTRSARLDVHEGSIATAPNLDGLLDGVDVVVAMLGDRATQKTQKVNTAFVRDLIPAMRHRGVSQFLYQAGGLSAPPGRRLSPLLWTIRNTIARGYIGQHEDNEAVMRYLAEEAGDIEWIVHRAGIGSDGPSKGVLERSQSKASIATFRDCAAYNYQIVSDPTAVHTCDLSTYHKG